MSGSRAVRRTLARHELRARWRVLLALGVAAGSFAGLTLAVVSLYLRSDSVYDRLVERTGQADARVGTYNVFNRLQDRDRVRVDLARARTEIVARPDVVDVQEMVAVYVRPVEQAATFFAVWAPTQPWRGIDQPAVIAGRLPSDTAPGEVMINEQRARQDGVGLGSRLTVGIFEAAQVRGDDQGLTEPRAGYRSLTVVGIYRSPDSGTGFNRYIAGPAFAARYAAAAGIGTLQLLRLDESRAEGTPLADQITQLNNRLVLDYGAGFYSYVDLAVPGETPDPVVGPTLAVLRAGLLGFLGVVGAVGLLVTAQLTRRLDELGHDDLGAVVALGVARRDLLAARLGAVAPAAVVAALVAAAGALLGGFVRPPGALAGFEAEPGWYFVLWPVVAGPVVVAALVLAAATVTVLAATRTRPPVLARRRTPAVRRVRIGPVAALAAALIRSGGSRRTGMRVRATMGSVATVVALLAAAVVLVDQLASIEANRNRWGWTPDFSVSSGSPEVSSRLAADRRVADADTVVDAPLVVRSGQRRATLSGYGRASIKGRLPYETTAGRVPSAANQIALGASAARELQVTPGDQVRLVGRTGAERLVTVTGIVVLPTLENEPLGRNALLPLPTLRATAQTNGYPNVFVRAVNPDAATAVRAGLPPGTGTLSPVAPPTVRALDRLVGPGRVLLAVLAGALLLLVAGHARQLVRRRGNQLAIAEAIGMPTRRVIGAAAGSVIGAAALAAAVGLPVGWAAGRVAVAELAPRLGLSPRNAPWGELLLGLVVITAVAGVAAALVIALLRVRSMRTGAVRPARGLRL